MTKNALEATKILLRNGPITELDSVYLMKGFIPVLPLGGKEWVPQVTSKKRQQVSVTLEHCYDDWCLAQMAKSLNQNEDYDFFMKRAHNYRNLCDPRIGFMAPKTADGKWVLTKMWQILFEGEARAEETIMQKQTPGPTLSAFNMMWPA